MTTAVRRARPARPSASAAVAAATTAAAQARAATNPQVVPVHRLTIEYIDINDVQKYEWNPRQNAEAVQNVAASMRLTGGFAMPVIVDDSNVLIAGHTRIEAAKSLGLTEAPIIRLSHLTPEQVAAFRVIDNKVAEMAKWDFELLAGEIGKLEGTGLDFTQFGWSQTELDCMSQLVAADCLSPVELAPVAQEAVEEVQRTGRGPLTARIVIGDIVSFVDIHDYRQWSEGLRALCDYDDTMIQNEIKRRLGLPV